MKINDHGGPGAPNRPGASPEVQHEVKRNRASAQETPAERDRVSVSEEARTLSRLRAEVGDIRGIRTERVEEIRTRIARGEFRVDLRAVARKLLESLFGERSG